MSRASNIILFDKDIRTKSLSFSPLILIMIMDYDKKFAII